MVPDWLAENVACSITTCNPENLDAFLDELKTKIKTIVEECINITPIGTRTLLTGEKVNEYKHSYLLQRIDTKCPDKWVFLDMEKAKWYRWDVRGKTWARPPEKVDKIIEEMMSFIQNESGYLDNGN